MYADDITGVKLSALHKQTAVIKELQHGATQPPNASVSEGLSSHLSQQSITMTTRRIVGNDECCPTAAIIML